MINILRTGYAVIFLAFFLLAVPAQAQRAQQPMLEPHSQAMPLLPYLDYYIDESLTMDIEEVAALNQDWQPYVSSNLPRVEGIVWLRFRIAPLAPDARPRTFLLDMGQSIPGQPILFDPVHNELSGAQEWRENFPAQRNILLLPEAGPEALTCYIRVDGLPGPWFAPMIRTPQNAASNWSSLARTGAILALGVVMLLCVLRGLSESGQWRYWTALFVGVTLCQAILGMPRQTQHFNFEDVAATMAPGLALMFLPHVGRHLMAARKYSRSIDIQLFLLSLPGAALAILPLVPGWNWLDRWADLWPACTVIFIPTALGAWLMRLPGSRRFLLASVLPPAFTAFGLLGAEFGISGTALASAPLWGVALSALLLAATHAPTGLKDEKEETKKKEPAVKKSGGKKQKKMPELALEPAGDIINLERPLDDPNLRIIPAPTLEETNRALEEEFPMDIVLPRSFSGAATVLQAGEARELALREPVEDIIRQSAALANCALPPSAKDAVAGITSAANKLGDILSNEDLPDEGGGKAGEELFNLQRVLRKAHDSVAAMAECSGIALSWYMPPHLGLFYRGNAQRLEKTLRLLLESSVRSSSHGAIKISARQLPGTTEAGHLLFSVSDDGNGYPPLERSGLALAKAWELTGEYGGYLSVESSREGTTISFTTHFTPADGEDAPGEREQLALILDDDAEERRKLARIIGATPCKTTEAANPAEALASQNQLPTPLLVARGKYARPASGDLVRDFCRIARNAGLSQCYALAITPDESQWPLLKASGFTHALLEPVDPEVLRRTVATLLDIPQPPTELFRPDGTVLDNNEDVAAAGDITPKMLIEQGFTRRDSFEGPHWLVEEGEMPSVSTDPGPLRLDGRDDRQEAAPTPHGEGTPDQPGNTFNVQNFMEGSATLVQSTLSDMLNQQEGAPARGNGDKAVADMLDLLDEKMRMAKVAHEAGNAQGVATAIGELADASENIGLRVVTRMARCVEKAAQQNDMAALKDIMPELGNAVERTRILILEKQGRA